MKPVGRPPLPPGQARTTVVQVRCNDRETAMLVYLSRSQGLPVATVAHDLIVESLRATCYAEEAILRTIMDELI